MEMGPGGSFGRILSSLKLSPTKGERTSIILILPCLVWAVQFCLKAEGISSFLLELLNVSKPDSTGDRQGRLSYIDIVFLTVVPTIGAHTLICNLF